MLNFNFKFTNPTGGTFVVDDDMIILRLESISPTTNNTLFFQIVARYVGTNNWKPVFVNDKEEFDVPSINLVSANWWITAALSSSNTLMQQTGRISANSNGATYKVQLLMAEAWNFTTNVRLRYFGMSNITTRFFNGQVGRIDYMGGHYEPSASSTNDDSVMEWKLPCNLIS